MLAAIREALVLATTQVAKRLCELQTTEAAVYPKVLPGPRQYYHSGSVSQRDGPGPFARSGYAALRIEDGLRRSMFWRARTELNVSKRQLWVTQSTVDIPCYWSPREALAVFELLDELRGQIWERYR